MAGPSKSRGKGRTTRRRGTGLRRWLALVAGLVLAGAALYALLGTRGPASVENIDDASRERLDSVIREESSQ